MIAVAAILFLVVLGRAWARLPLAAGRTLAWLMLFGAIVGLERFYAESDPILRMGVLCGVLLAGLKAVVYVEWSSRGGRALSLGAYLAFGLGWFGMDPTPFAGARRTCDWRGDFRVGLTCVIVGTLLALVVRNLGWTAWVLPVFVPMSIGFHYGALRLLTAFWRSRGVPVRVLFRNPLVSSGLADFWSRRWNLAYSEMMVRVVKRPLQGVLGRGGSDFAVFLVSGLLHEVAITLPVGAGFGLPTLYFVLHGLVVRIKTVGWPAWLVTLWTLGWVAGPIGILFPRQFFEEVILRCLQVLPELNLSFTH
jgi:alginate O-acetyltransferase complex protein AlgI